MKSISLTLFLILILFSCSKDKKSIKRAQDMRDFVVKISKYAKASNPDFAIIPQNGIELCFNNEDLNDGINSTYMDAIDGVGIEELFYNQSALEDDGRLAQAIEISKTKKVLVADYMSDNNLAPSFELCDQNGFIAYPRTYNNYNYEYISDSVHMESNADVTTLQDAQNYLYLISSNQHPTKESYLNAIASTNFDVVLIDLFYNEEQLTASEVNSLKTKANGGKRLVISYMNIGSAENYRYYWKKKWRVHCPGWLKKKYDGYDDEIWVKFWKKEWQNIILNNDDAYIKKVLDSNFDGVYLDNIEAYYFLYFD